MNQRYIRALVLIILLIFPIIGFTVLVQTTPPPSISTTHGETQIHIQADTGWLLTSSDCATISWDVEGIQGLYLNGSGQVGQGTMDYCPATDLSTPQFNIVDANGVHRYISLDIHYLPDLLLYLAGFVGVGFTLLYTIYMLFVVTPDKPFPIFGSLVAILILLTIGTVLRLNAPVSEPIHITSDTVSLSFWSEHDHIVFPDECITVGWSVVGAEQIMFNGVDMPSLGNPTQASHCSQDGDTAELTVVDSNGKSATYTLPVPSIFPYLENTTIFAILSVIGIVLSALVFVPLVYQKLRTAIANKQTSDLIAVLGFFSVVLLIYLPFGFDSIGHWEEWVIASYIEGKSANLIASEMVSRYWVIVPHTLAYLISSESFVGFHLVNLMMFWGKMVLLYSILRHLRLSHVFAFLTTVIFLVYPVNTALMSLRSFPMQFSAVTLLIAVYLILDYRKQPSRLKLLGIWWGLSFNIFSNESAYVIILVLPLIWWLNDRKLFWKNFNLTAIWYLYPAYKVALLLILSNTSRAFYQSGLVSGESTAEQVMPGLLTVFQRTLQDVFRVTFVDGWRDSLSSVSTASFIPVALVILGLVIVVTRWLTQQTDDEHQTSRRQYVIILFSSLLLIPPSVGVLMWIPLYRGDLWRMYFYVPIAGALVVMALLFLLTYPIRHKSILNGLILVVSVGLMFPATARLMSQHDQYVTSAENKATVLHNVIEIAPHVTPDTHILLTTDLSREQLEALGMFEFIRRDMFNSALYILYGERRPAFAYFCLDINVCSNLPDEETIFNLADVAGLLENTIILSFNADLSVELVGNPADVFDIDADTDGYNPTRLLQESDHLPKRVETMLSSRAR